jgi:hypothetical protein
MTAEWVALWVAGALVTADIDLPPAKYDHPYRGQVQYVYDFPRTYNGDLFWGYTVAPQHKGGKCVIHLSPVGSVSGKQVMTEAALERLIRHETAHCNSYRHRDDPLPWPSPPSVPPTQTTDVRQRFCVSVMEPPPSVKQDPEYDPNQWLAVREGPGAKFEVITKMGSVGHFEADAVDGDWTHVVDPEIQGRVSSKYVQECSAARP